MADVPVTGTVPRDRSVADRLDETPSRRGVGVRGRLYSAFIGLTTLVILASAISFFSLLRVDRALNEITEDSVPLVISALDLSRQAERIVSAAPALLNVDGFEDLATVRASLNDDVARLDELLKELALHSDETQAIGSIRRASEQLRGTLDAMQRVVTARLAIEAQKEQRHAEAAAATSKLVDLIEPMQAEVDDRIRDLRRSPRAALPESPLVEAVELRARLQRARDELDLILSRFGAITSASAEELTTTTLNIGWSLDRIGQLRTLLDASERESLREAIGEISQYIQGPRDLSQIRLTELQLINAGEISRAENAGLAERFSAGVDRMVEAVEANIVEANADALATKQLTASILIGVVLMSIVGSVSVVWLYVQRNVIARLTRLTDSMMAIAGGDLERPLPNPGGDEIGRMAQALTVFRDTAVEVKETNLREVSEARRRLDDAIESTQEGFALFGADDRLILRNSKYGELLYDNVDVPKPGAHYETILRQAVRRGLIVGVGPEGSEEYIRERLEEHRDPQQSQIQQRASGRWLRINEHRTEDGGTVVVYSDITTLQKRQEELEEMDRLKSQFLSSVSHELRTPLTSVRGFAKLVLKDFERHFAPIAETDPKLAKKAERICDNIEIVQSEGERLTRLINEVLDLAKIESGDIQWNDTTFPVHDLVEGAYRASIGHFENKPDLEPILELDDDLPMIHADYDRLFQVLINLINNAAKFTEAGFVRVRASRLGDRWVDIRVIDTGPGIAPADAAKIFDKFHQVMTQDTLSDKPKGTGLGLSISRQIVEHYGGSIWVESLVGEGSTFAFKIPSVNHAFDQDVRPEPRPGAASKSRILVVEDDPAYSRYLQQVLRDVGFDVETAGNGAEAIEKASRLQPNLITMDHRMPKMDGGAAIRTLRSSEDLRNIPVIYITGHRQDTDAGADTVLEKPVLEQTLLRSVRLLLGQQAGRLSNSKALVIEEAGRTTAIPDHLKKLRRIERVSLEQVRPRVEDGFDGVVILPENLVGAGEIEDLVTRSGVWSLVTVGEDS